MPEDEFFNTFVEKLKEATKNIEKYYFEIGIANLKGHRFRERVYCYELYHQIRKRLKQFPYVLQGEMDKSGHPRIPGGRKPDFILHTPEAMDDNFLVIEVKPLNNANKAPLKKDLGTLTKFLDLGYHKAIHLIYGTVKRKEEGIAKVIRAYKEYNRETGKLNTYRDKLLLLWHKNFNQPAELYDWEKEVFNSNNT